MKSPVTSNIPGRGRTCLEVEVHCIGFSSGSAFCLNKTNTVTRMVINPGIPTPSAMPRVSLERPVNGTKDGEDEDVAVCTVDSVKVTIAGTDAEVFVEPKVGVGIAVEPKVGVDVADPD